MDKRYFSDKIVKWYLENQRELPWRATRDPYKIWLSEIILQQTRVSQGLPYYQTFVSKYPKIENLANASETEILRTWQGLGYYTRARNLHKCAKAVVKNFNGKFPSTFEELRQLPGIGDYTAAAIASFSFKEPVAVVDGNVFRVLARLFGIDTAINSNEGKKEFNTLANSLLKANQPDVYNQAMMEFGATWCTPKSPRCQECPFERNCRARQQSLELVLPVKLKSKPSRKRFFYYLVVEDGKRLVMRRRIQDDIWKGLYDFHLIERNRPIDVKKLLSEKEFRELTPNSEFVRVSKTYKHILSHQTIHSKFVILRANGRRKTSKQPLKAYTLTQVGKLPKPVLVSRFLTDHYVS